MDPESNIERIEVAIASLCADEFDGSSAPDLRSVLERLKRAESKLTAEIGRLTFLADSVGAHLGTGARDTAEWLGRRTGTSGRRNRTAGELGEAMSRSAALAGAVAEGDLSVDAANVVVGAADGEAVDSELIESVRDLPLGSIKPEVERWRNRRRPDDAVDRAQRQRARRYVRLTDQPDGMTRIEGLLDPDSAATVRSTLDGIISQSAFDGSDRSRDQRRHDALVQLAHAAAKGQLVGGRSNAKLLVNVPFETVTERGSAPGCSHVGSPIDPETVRRMACDAGIHRVVTAGRSSILDFGHETRLVSENLFLALVARDQHCRWPGCTMRATWCDAHHIVHWTDDGVTDQENCVLLCHRHHQLSHEVGYSVTGTGHELRVEFPDGSVEIGRPPGFEPFGRSDPPDVSPPRAGPPGRENLTADVLASLQHAARQLSLV